MENIREIEEKVKVEKGENTEGFTATPNLFLDNLYLFPPSEGYVLLTIIRKTIGWHKEWDRISLSQLSKITGLTKRTIQKSTARLVKKGFILRCGGGKKKAYQYYFNYEKLKECVEKTEENSAKVESELNKRKKFLLGIEKNTPYKSKYRENFTPTKYNYKENIQKKDIVGTLGSSIDNPPFSNSSENSFKDNSTDELSLKKKEPQNVALQNEYPKDEIALRERIEKLAVKMIKKGPFNNLTPDNHRTKKFEKIVDTLVMIAEGEFKPELNKKWRKDWNLRKNIFKRKYANFSEFKKMLILAVSRYKHMFHPDYQPSNKDILTRDFLKFLYNQHCRKSWLMFCANREPENSAKLEARKIREKISPEDRKPIEEFYRPGFNELVYWKRMYSLYRWWEENRETLRWQNFLESGFDSYFRNWRAYFGYYTEYLKGWRDLSASQLGDYTTVWHRFNDHIKQTFGYDLFPDEDKARLNKTLNEG